MLRPDKDIDIFIDSALYADGVTKTITPEKALMELIRRSADRRMRRTYRIVFVGVCVCMVASLASLAGVALLLVRLTPPTP